MWPPGRPDGYPALLAQLAAPDAPAWVALLDAAAGDDRTVLYVGAGGGRRAVEIARAGWSVRCVERDPAAVAALEDRLKQDAEIADVVPRIDVELASIETSSSTADFGVVMAPDLVLSYAASPGAQRAVLAACAARCAPGGLVVLDVVNPFPFVAALLGGGGPVGDGGPFPIAVGGEPTWTSVSYHAAGLDVARQAFALGAVYRVRFLDGETREYVDQQPVRWLLPDELVRLAEAAGLEPAELDCTDLASPTWRVVLRRTA